VKHRDFSSIKQYRAFLEEFRLTEAEARHRVKIQLLQKRIEEHVTAGVPKAHRIAASLRVTDAYDRGWRARTICRAALATDGCSNGPPLPSASGSAAPVGRRSAHLVQIRDAPMSMGRKPEI
jgi:hypothetical protein